MWPSPARGPALTARPTPSRLAPQSVAQQPGLVMWPSPAQGPAPTVRPTASSLMAPPAMTAALRPAMTSARLGPVQARPAEGEPQGRGLTPRWQELVVEAEVIDP